MSGTTWIERYDSLKARFTAKRARGLVFTDEEVVFTQENLNALQLDLKLLVTMPNGPDKPPQSEIARREVLLSNMGVQLRSVKEMTSVSTSNALHAHGNDERAPSTESVSDRVAKMHLFGRSEEIGIGGSRPSHGKGYNPLSTSEAGLGMRVMEMRQMQNGMVDDIGQGVDRLHQQALTLGDETQLHTRLLDDMESNVDFAIEELQQDAERTKRLREQVHFTKLYVILLVEVIIVFFLLLYLFA